MSAHTLPLTIGFLGFGNMGGAVARGLIAAGIVPGHNILVHDPMVTSETLIDVGAIKASSAEDLFAKADVILLAVKPQVFQQTADAWRGTVEGLSGKTVISVMAGIRAAKLREVFPGFTAVRVMPNLGLSVGEGATAIAVDGLAEEALVLTETIFRSAGATARVSEAQMDAVTAVSGSGPMYLFEFVEAMTAAGEKAGLDREAAYTLVLQTVKGSLKLLETSSDSPDAWTKRVCSPGGTTLAALGMLQAEGFHAVLEKAVAAAAQRSKELSGG